MTKDFLNINRRQFLGGITGVILGPKNISTISQTRVSSILSQNTQILHTLPNFDILDYGFSQGKSGNSRSALIEFNKRLEEVFPGENISPLPSWEEKDIELWMKRNYNKKRETYFQIHGKFLLSLPIEFQNCLYSPNSHISIDEDGLYQILEDIRQGHASEKSDYTFFNTSYSFKITDMENTQDTIYLDLEFQGDRINIEGHIDEKAHWCNGFSFSGEHEEVRNILSKAPGDLLRFIKLHTDYLQRLEEQKEYRKNYENRHKVKGPNTENTFTKFLLSTTYLTPVSQYRKEMDIEFKNILEN